MALATTTQLTLTLSDDILVDANVTLDGGDTGAVKGTLQNSGGGVYALPIFNIAQAGDVTVNLAKDGYTFNPASKTVAVNYVDTP
ncbi:MAG: hypothetical protein Ta2A_11080 [Treponemataceae bacterium]|nr:MAG: hypothetical protein Ta2A_11080 [Treponemataceae bacterium]